ncbi:hypothetical protein ACFQ3Z_34105 [Streptomyces nogalater]
MTLALTALVWGLTTARGSGWTDRVVLGSSAWPRRSRSRSF